MINFFSCSRDKYLEFGMKHILEPVITKQPQSSDDTLLFLVDETMPLDSLLALRRRKDIEIYSKIIILSDSLSWECVRRFIPGSTHFYIVRCSTAIHSFLGQINALLAKERLISSGYSKRLLTNKEKNGVFAFHSASKFPDSLSDEFLASKIKSHYKQRAMKKLGIKNNPGFSALINSRNFERIMSFL
ncbi:response regulator transcription factor [Salmonella enterica]|nr:response regulator transcription factor [Salmonella enterica]